VKTPVGGRQAFGCRALRHDKIKGPTGVYVRTLASFATNKVGNVVAIGCVIAMAFFSFQAFPGGQQWRGILRRRRAGHRHSVDLGARQSIRRRNP
jgi:hypothetical protein